VFFLNAAFVMTFLDLMSRVYLTSLFSGHPDSHCRILALCCDDIMDIAFIFITVKLYESLVVLVAHYWSMVTIKLLIVPYTGCTA
jgi:hypothetical protein